MAFVFISFILFDSIFLRFSTILERVRCVFIIDSSAFYAGAPFFDFEFGIENTMRRGSLLLSNFPTLCLPYFVVIVFWAMFTIKTRTIKYNVKTM